MAITKTNFINYTRCRRFVALNEIKKEKLNADISYKEYKEEEQNEVIQELLSSMYSLDENNEEQDLIDVKNEQLEVMLPYYNEVENLAGKKIEKLFGGKTIYAKATYDQEGFEYEDDLAKYICYVDIMNETEDEINIIEVKATTSKKYLEDLKTGFRSTKERKREKYPIFYEIQKDIFKLKEEGYDYSLEMPSAEYLKKRKKLLDRYDSVGKYVYDLSVQRMIIENSKKHNKKINYYLGVLNHEYVFDGNYVNNVPDYKDDIIVLFELNKITEEMQDKIKNDKNRIIEYIKKMDASDCDLGDYCEFKSPTECKYTKICFKKIPKNNSSLSYMNNGFGFKDELGNVHKGLQLINEGYLNMLDVPESWVKNENHFIQRNSLLTKKPYINKEKLKIALQRLKYPIYHLDFETFPCPLPRFKGEKCYTQSVFQFSLHIEREPGKCHKDQDHYEFLSRDFNYDCKEELTKKLCEYIDPSKGTLFAQNVPFEKARIKELANILPQYKDKLNKMLDISFDLLYIVKNNSKLYLELGYDPDEAKMVNFYDYNLSGSYSIKKMLPIFTNLSYNDLAVGNGTEALTVYANYNNYSKEEKEQKYKDLIEYCKQDTYAMVLILDKVRTLV